MAFGKQKRRLRPPLVESYSLEYYSPCLQTNPNNINSRPRPAVYICRNYPMYLLPASSCIPEQNTKSCVNVISEGSPSRIRMVLRISFGITTRPKSSILLTIPVAFILCLLFMVSLFWDSFDLSKLLVLSAESVLIYADSQILTMFRYADGVIPSVCRRSLVKLEGFSTPQASATDSTERYERFSIAFAF